MKSKIALTVCFASLLVLVKSIIFNDQQYAEVNVVKPTILLGGLFPVHTNQNGTCGEILDLGYQRLEAMVFATRTINESPDILPRVNLVFQIRDTCVRVNNALEESLPFVISRNISGVVGAASSSVSIAVANLLRLFHVPQISYASTAKVLSDKTRFEYFFRTVPPDSLQARAIADIIFMFNWTFIHTIYSDDAYGNEGINAVLQELAENNNSKVCIASSSKISPGTTEQKVFDEAVQKLDNEWSRNSTVVVIFGQLSTATGILQAVKRRDAVSRGFSQRLTWIGSDAWGDQLSTDLHEIAKGMLSVTPKAFLSADFDRYFESLNPLNYTSNPWLGEYWEFFFNCSFTNIHKRKCKPASEVISAAGGYKQNSKVTFTIDAVYAFAHAIQNMINTLCPDNYPCPAIIASSKDTVVNNTIVIREDILLSYLRNVTFNGTSGDTIEFDSSGDEEGDFLVKNLKEILPNVYHYKTVGLWLHTRELDFHGTIDWQSSTAPPQSLCSHPCKGGEFPETVSGQPDCCWTCKPCPSLTLVSNGSACYNCPIGWKPNAGRTECVVIVPTYLQWDTLWSIIIGIASFLGVITTVFIMVTFVLWRNHEIVKASSRELSGVLLTGLLLCNLLPVVFIALPSAPICTVRRFGVGFVFSLCYSALLVRTNRIFRIFNRLKTTTQKPILISPQSQLIFTFLLVSVQVAIAAIWLALEPPRTVIMYDGFEAELKCGESPYISLCVSLAYNFVLLLLSCYYAFRSRNIPQNYNETKFINITLYSTVIIWLAFIPTYFGTAGLGTVYQTISLVLGVIFSAATAIGCFFMPKLFVIFKPKCFSNEEDSEDPVNSLMGGRMDMHRSSSISAPNPQQCRNSIDQMFPSRRKTSFNSKNFDSKIFDSKNFDSKNSAEKRPSVERRVSFDIGVSMDRKSSNDRQDSIVAPQGKSPVCTTIMCEYRHNR